MILIQFSCQSLPAHPSPARHARKRRAQAPPTKPACALAAIIAV
ncbi:MAG TPA: hypothetical protein PK693_10220 [Halothiobacillus sp.]|nr:hypothetical protein [Halothiobacillus sp.]HQS29204.1 hypothetical protein [Halothiobacillus sp.]